MSLPRIAIVDQAAKRLRHYDAWVFQDELVEPQPSIAPGEPVEIVTAGGRFVAYGFYNPRSHIALRALSLAQDQPITPALLAGRIADAIAHRQSIRNTNARRLVFSEADALPGLIVDQYDRVLVVQFRTAGMDRFRAAALDALRALEPAGILDRSDKEFREEEGLPPVTQVLDGAVPDRIAIEEEGLRFLVDPYRGLKTGFFLDQRDARRRLRELVTPGQRLLDVFSYTGGFGIAAAAGGAQVVCVEQDEAFLSLAKENARLNQVEHRMQFVAGNAFYWLDAKANARERLDWVILDPPGLAKTRADIRQGRQALHHLLVRAMAMLPAGGKLAVSLCTYHLLGLAEEIIRIAAAEHGMRVRVREQWLQAQDHPWVLQIPATRYLTTWLLETGARSAD